MNRITDQELNSSLLKKINDTSDSIVTINNNMLEITNQSSNSTNSWFMDKKTGFIYQYGHTRTVGANVNNTYTHNLTFPIAFKSGCKSFNCMTARCEKADGTTIRVKVNILGYTVYDSKSRIGIIYTVDTYVEGSIIINWQASGY